MRCEMCGKEVDVPNRARVEGSILLLCGDCTRFGTVISGPALTATVPDDRPTTPVPIAERLVARGRRLEERDLFRELPDLELAADWSKKMRAAREKLGWSPEDLGKKLNEKKSIVLKMEAGSFRPPDAMVPKIEHLLKIRLRAEPGANV